MQTRGFATLVAQFSFTRGELQAEPNGRARLVSSSGRLQVQGDEDASIARPNGSGQVNELHSVSALAENDVWAVGVSYNTERTLGSTLIEHWNGSRWSVVPSPNPSSSVNMINAVAAVSANDVWAVGTAPTSTDTVLILHWNGTAWSVVPNPTNGIPLANLAALAVISANDIWAVGSGFIGDEGATATLHWNGTA